MSDRSGWNKKLKSGKENIISTTGWKLKRNLIEQIYNLIKINTIIHYDFGQNQMWSRNI